MRLNKGTSEKGGMGGGGESPVPSSILADLVIFPFSHYQDLLNKQRHTLKVAPHKYWCTLHQALNTFNFIGCHLCVFYNI